jgi:hypothetical protein
MVKLEINGEIVYLENQALKTENETILKAFNEVYQDILEEYGEDYFPWENISEDMAGDDNGLAYYLQDEYKDRFDSVKVLEYNPLPDYSELIALGGIP